MRTEADAQDSLFFRSYWFPSELRLLQPPEDVTTAEWAERHIYVVKSVRPGSWKNDNNPPLVGIMNAADRKGIFRNMKIEVVMKGVQTGVTTAAHNIILKRMDGSAQNAMIVMESEKKMRRVMKQRLIEFIKRSPRLSGQISNNPDDTTNYSITMASGFCLNTGWAGSQAAVASDPCETVILDEIDKYDTPLNLEEAKDRITTYQETGLAVMLSTPGLDGGPIVMEFNNCDAVFDYHAVCPECAHVQPMKFENFWWPEKGDKPAIGEWKRIANRVQRERSARYACGGCGSLWDDYTRDKAVKLGVGHFFHGWKMRENVDYPVSAGFHFPSWISPFKTLSEVVARWLRAQEADQSGKLRAWHNNEAAAPYIEAYSERKDDAILALKDDRPRGLVPKGIAALLGIVDTQQRGFYYEVRAFGWGSTLESWQIREGYVETFEGLNNIMLNSEYKDVDGKNYAIQAAFMDSGGGTGTVPKHSRTAEVYEFCRLNPIFRPLKGRQRMTTTTGVTQIDYYPRTKKPIPGGLTLYTINVTFFKDQLSTKLAIDPHDPGAWHLHSECSNEYAREMTAEYRNDKGVWICPQNRPNHYWDIGVYALAAAEILQIKFWKKQTEDAQKPSSRRIISKGIE